VQVTKKKISVQMSIHQHFGCCHALMSKAPTVCALLEIWRVTQLHEYQVTFMSVAASECAIMMKIIGSIKSKISSGHLVLSEFITMLPEANTTRPYY